MLHLCVFAFLYFIQGLPYGLQSKFLPVYFRTHGMSLTDISFFKMLLVPWMCKALWAPFVDHYKTKKVWLEYSMIGLIITCLIGSCTSPTVIPLLAFVLLMFNLVTSVQDIAVDGIAIEILDSNEFSYANIAQVVGYKLGAVFSGGLLVWLSEYVNWTTLFLSLSGIYLASFVMVKHFIQSRSRPKKTNTESKDEEANLSWWLLHIKEVMSSPGTKWMMIFVLIYKLGEQGCLSLTPLFLLDQGVTTSQVGLWTGMIGQMVSISGSILGGIIPVLRSTSLKTLKVTCMWRIFPILGQVLVIWSWKYSNNVNYSIGLSVFCMLVMLLISGTVTTATFTLMMQCSKLSSSHIQATHYTILASLEVLGKLTFSVMIGPVTDVIGYKFVFIVFLVLSLVVIPMFKCIPNCIVEESNRVLIVEKSS